VGSFFFSAFLTFFACFLIVPIVLFAFTRLVPMVVVHERQCLVFELFGKVIGKLDEPGLHFLPLRLGVPNAWLVGFLGRCHVVDMRMDQQYLRSLPVNSEEGAPMGIGVWYEMYISDPEAFLFRNADPRGSLDSNVRNATVRCLSNLHLADMMENRHQMSRTVRAEVSAHSTEWGYRLGSVYIRKVHFRDRTMMRQIEEKVVNRLRQVTGAITQDGANQVSLIRGSADRQAAVEFARAAAIRPQVVGEALRQISQDPEVAQALFEVLETEKILQGQGALTLIPSGGRQDLMVALAAAAVPAVGPTTREPRAPSAPAEPRTLPGTGHA